MIHREHHEEPSRSSQPTGQDPADDLAGLPIESLMNIVVDDEPGPAGEQRSPAAAAPVTDALDPALGLVLAQLVEQGLEGLMATAVDEAALLDPVVDSEAEAPAAAAQPPAQRSSQISPIVPPAGAPPLGDAADLDTAPAGSLSSDDVSDPSGPLAGSHIAAPGNSVARAASGGDANAVPVATGSLAGMERDTPIGGQLTAGDVDNVPADLLFSLAAGPAHGIVSIGAGGAYSYTPDAGYTGNDSFGFRVTDPGGASATATVAVEILAPGVGFAAGAEYRVNTTTAADQLGSATAKLADGSFVVIWQSKNQDGSGDGIYAQLYDASGTAAGAEFRVNSTTNSDQIAPAVAALAGGGFVVAWQSQNQDGSNGGIYAQRYDAAGAAAGAEFRVNSTTNSDQIAPAVAALAGGGFVVAWQSQNQDGSGDGIYAQRYDAAGAAAGAEFRANSYTTGDQANPAVAALTGGGFVVAWQSMGQDGSLEGVFAQRYDAAGAAAGAEFRANSYTTGDQANPAVAALTGGGFVVAWQSMGQDGSLEGVFAQRYDAAGTATGAEFRVNGTTADAQTAPSVAALADGGFLVTWQSAGQDGDGLGVFAQRYDAAGGAVGSEFRLNSFTAGAQDSPSITALADGGFVATWSSDGQDGSGYGIYAKVFQGVAGTSPHGFVGGAGNDSFIGGAGNDSFRGGLGIDRMTGGAGRDIFDFDSLAEGRDIVTDFASGIGGDVLDVADILGGVVTGATVGQFIQLVDDGANTTVRIDPDGGADGFVDLVVLQGVTGVTAVQLFADGNIDTVA